MILAKTMDNIAVFQSSFGHLRNARRNFHRKFVPSIFANLQPVFFFSFLFCSQTFGNEVKSFQPLTTKTKFSILKHSAEEKTF
jgi:hypothetical protein